MIAAGHEGECSADLQQRTAHLWQPSLLAQPQPCQPRTFQREHRAGGARRQRQRHRQRGKAHCQHCMRLRQHGVRRPPDQRPRQHRIDRGQAQRAQRQRHRLLVQHARLQRECDQRRAEHQAAIDQVTPPGRLATRVQQRDQQVEREEQQQERFGAAELARRVLQHAPERTDAEREGEAQQVQRAPRTEPGNGEDARVEHRVVAEQAHVVATAGGQPQRRHEAGEDAQHRQRARILLHCKHAQPGHQRDRAGEGEAGRNQLEPLERREDGQQQHADGAALQGQREHPPAPALVPAEREQAQRAHGDAGQAQLDRQHQPALVADVLQHV
ncbi:hypothetical protein G6F22_014520 [Rhizopus arrhizus]|nr:hypothetical protein G6F22_014520 [Rhizopus arrhizus]